MGLELQVAAARMERSNLVNALTGTLAASSLS
jgi:hypothetical protein